METATSNEDVLVVLQTENGEQIALPMSALPNDFVPGDSGQIIMVESGLDEQQQEIVVESSDLSGQHQTSSSDLVSLQHVDPTPHISTLDSLVPEGNDSMHSNDNITNESSTQAETLVAALPTTSYADKPTGPRTYSKNSVVKSYAPTCGPARIYQQCQPVPGQQQQEQSQTQPQQHNQLHHQPSDQIQSKSFQNCNSSTTTGDDVVNKTQLDNNIQPNDTEALPVQPEEKPVVVPRCKQKRKYPLLLRPLNDEDDLKLEYIVMKEPSPPVQEPEIKRRRKEHRTKKSKIKQHSPQLQQVSPSKQHHPQQEQEQEHEQKQKQKHKQPQQVSPEPENEQHSPKQLQSPSKQRQQQQQQQHTPKQDRKQYSQNQQPQSERRTRLSNACRVATSKSYKCNDCDFSTDRINNIVLHVKEQCPYAKKKDTV